MQATVSFACLDGTNYSEATKYGYQRNPRNVGMTFLFAILTIIIIFITKTLRSEVTAHSSTSSSAYPHINMRTYVGGCVRAGAYNLILIFASYYYAPWTWPWPCTVYR